VSLRTAVRRLALAKAEVSVADCQGLVLGVDTIVVLDGKVIGKPRDRSHARDIIRQLQGKEHQVITGMGVVDTVSGRRFSRSDVAMVRIYPLSEAAIDSYCMSADILDKAGAYGIQDTDNPIVESVDGSRYTVMGLAITQLLDILKDYSIGF